MRKMMKIEITPAFMLLACAAVVLDRERLLPAAFLCSIIHEEGHVIAMRLCGVKPEKLRLSGKGAEIVAADRYKLSYPAEMAVCLAGPAANLLTGFIFILAGFELLAGISFILGILNLLPLSVLDGGGLVGAICGYLGYPDNRISSAFDIAAAVLMLSAAVIMLLCGKNITIFSLSIWLLLSPALSSVKK